MQHSTELVNLLVTSSIFVHNDNISYIKLFTDTQNSKFIVTQKPIRQSKNICAETCTEKIHLVKSNKINQA